MVTNSKAKDVSFVGGVRYMWEYGGTVTITPPLARLCIHDRGVSLGPSMAIAPRPRVNAGTTVDIPPLCCVLDDPEATGSFT